MRYKCCGYAKIIDRGKRMSVSFSTDPPDEKQTENVNRRERENDG